MATKSPLNAVKEKFGDKAKLVEAVKAFTTDELWLARTRADRRQDKGLEQVSNTKLLKLHKTFSEVKDKFGTRAKLVDSILELEKRTKDDGFKARLDGFPVPRLYDHYKSANRRAKRASAKAEAVKK